MTSEISIELQDHFASAYNAQPQWVVRAPGRVNLIGEHTDYNDGFVLPMALERDTIILAAPNDSTKVTFRSTAQGYDSPVHIDLNVVPAPGPKGHWSNYPRGVIAGFLGLGHKIPGFDALVQSTVPVGGGVSSSAALEVATATLLELMIGKTLGAIPKALLCQKAEHDFAGVPCGIMDQFVSTLGRKDRLLLLDCRSRAFEHIKFSDPSISVLIINSNIQRKLSSEEYGDRRAQCEKAAEYFGERSLRDVTIEQLNRARGSLPSALFFRARHVVGEIARTTHMKKCVLGCDWAGAGQLMYKSHTSLQQDFQVSCPELDAIVDIAKSIGHGMYGCRMTGAGFGGCAVALIQSAAEPEITRTITDRYRAMIGFAPTIFSSRPGEGASVLRP